MNMTIFLYDIWYLLLSIVFILVVTVMPLRKNITLDCVIRHGNIIIHSKFRSGRNLILIAVVIICICTIKNALYLTRENTTRQGYLYWLMITLIIINVWCRPVYHRLISFLYFDTILYNNYHIPHEVVSSTMTR